MGQSEGGKLRRTEDGTQDYGDKKVEIADYHFFDDTGRETTTYMKGSEFSVKVKIHANEDVEALIVALTIRNIKGIDVTGTNTMMEK